MLDRGIVKILKKYKIKNVCANSKLVKRGDMFVAIRGPHSDGNKFIAEAIKMGARAVLFDSDKVNIQGARIPLIKVGSSRHALADLAAYSYNNPSNRIKVVGITGTNGKTTISYLLESILKESKFSPGVIGTINYRFNRRIIAANNTTPGPLELQSILAQMRNDRVRYAVMEVSSHALDQDRVCGIIFHSAIFTNLTQDHLDYHKTFSNYFKAKAKLFSTLRQHSFAVINNDDKYAKKLIMITRASKITYGIRNKSDVMASRMKFSVSGTEFRVKVGKEEFDIKTNLIGQHNVYNILAAVAWSFKAGLNMRLVKKAIEKFSFVPGRLERINCRKGFSVFVDYAHTDDALKNILTALREIGPKRIITVFGCGGERDKLKRPKMGRIATSLSDFAIVTSDNPRSEDPRSIARDIIKGIGNKRFALQLDRAKAIRKAIAMARAGDIIVLAGKGHENYQIFKDRKIDFDDRKEAKECLRSLNY